MAATTDNNPAVVNPSDKPQRKVVVQTADKGDTEINGVNGVNGVHNTNGDRRYDQDNRVREHTGTSVWEMDRKLVASSCAMLGRQ